MTIERAIEILETRNAQSKAEAREATALAVDILRVSQQICKQRNRHRRGQYWNKRYAQLKHDGLCIQCAQKPPKAGYVRCEECLMKQKSAQLRHKAKVKAEREAES